FRSAIDSHHSMNAVLGILPKSTSNSITINMDDFAIDVCSAFTGQEVYSCGDLRRLSTTSCGYGCIEEAGVQLINIVARCVGSPVAKDLTRCALDRLHHLVSYIPLHDK